MKSRSPKKPNMNLKNSPEPPGLTRNTKKQFVTNANIVEITQARTLEISAFSPI